MAKMNEIELSPIQAYEAMYEYISRLYERTESADLAIMLSEMSFLEDGGTADSAAWYDWQECMQKAIDGNVDAKLKFRKNSS